MVVIYMLILLPAHEYKAVTFVLYAEPRTNVGMFELERRNKARVDVIVPYVRTFGKGAKKRDEEHDVHIDLRWNKEATSS